MGFGSAVAFLMFGLVVHRYYWLDARFALVDSINLVFHEAGHVIFSPFSRLVGVAGGSGFELLLPLGLTLLALRDRHWTATGGCLVWLSTALYSVSVYAADARARDLPLLGGHAVIHDWWFLLRHFGLLEHDGQIALGFWAAGLGAALLGLALLALGVLRRRHTPEIDD